ncbi:MAG TPA: DinB family protein [Methylomirabilota bacterium]|nr:DinB family protein [Methylomirabilota bacterium]
MPTAIARPAPGEFIEYYGKYISLVPGEDALPALRDQIRETARLLKPLDEPRALHRYAPGKWSVKEVVGHISDSERVFAYRALRIGRGDKTPLPGFDEKTYTPGGRFDTRPLAEILGEYEAVRAASLALFGGMDGEALLRRGTANGNEISVRALAWITAGHELHHRKLLTERYGVGK